MVTIKLDKPFTKTVNYFDKLKTITKSSKLDKYGRAGVEALKAATPKDSGDTANAWDYEIVKGSDNTTIYWTNSHTNDGVNIAVILQYGHGTGSGGYVQAKDYINPAMKDIFQDIADAAWKEVTSA